MRVAFDCRTITSPKTGDRTYALNLATALARIDTANEYDFYTWDPVGDDEFKQSHLNFTLLPARPRWTWTPFVFPRELGRAHAGLAHVQYIVPPFAPCPIVTTVHDISFRRFPRLFPLKHRLLLNLLVPLSARRAAAVITGSESTKQEMIHYYHLPPEKITVTPYGADAMFRPQDQAQALQAVQARYEAPSPYILCVGVLQPRKNLARLVRAYNAIAHHIPHRLVIVGKQGWANAELQQAVAATPIGHEAIFTGYVPDEDLPALYAAADVFVYPSVYEGFGLPPLEAMSCGTPVITSNTSCLPEVVGDAAVTVDPYSEKAIADAIQRVLSDQDLRRNLSDAGLRQASLFSWDRTARMTVDVYASVAKSRHGRP